MFKTFGNELNYSRNFRINSMFNRRNEKNLGFLAEKQNDYPLGEASM
jgi:hypothetical protein